MWIHKGTENAWNLPDIGLCSRAATLRTHLASPLHDRLVPHPNLGLVLLLRGQHFHSLCSTRSALDFYAAAPRLL